MVFNLTIKSSVRCNFGQAHLECIIVQQKILLIRLQITIL